MGVRAEEMWRARSEILVEGEGSPRSARGPLANRKQKNFKKEVSNMRKLLLIPIIAGLAFVACDKTSSVSLSDPVAQTTAVAPLSTDLTQDEVQSLIHMREEEKLARDVYLTLYNQWNLRVFSNIASSEQSHTNAVKTLLDRYNIPDPVTNDSIGYFSDPQLGALYQTLVEQGSRSLLDALIVGATIEDLDIYDLDEALENIAVNPDVIRVYTHLVHGSENHLRAFYGQIVNRGGAYSPQYISQERFDEIISGSNGRRRFRYGKVE